MKKTTVKRLTENIRPPNNDTPVTLKITGNVFEVRYSPYKSGGKIKKLSKDEYVNTTTGEVKSFTKNDDDKNKTRADCLPSVAQSLKNLRDIINCNITNPDCAIWLTLTYKENMKDPARLYNDMEKFTKRLRYYLKKQELPTVEYIYCIEPQSRGAFHAHCILIFNAAKAPYIPNADMVKIWGHGFTKTQSLKNIANPGLYLTAYLCDMELSEAIKLDTFKTGGLKEVSSKDDEGKPIKKAIVKGARLRLYPANMRIFRVSRNIQRPIISNCTEGIAHKIIENAPLTFERTIKIVNDDNDFNTINYRQYTKNKKQ